MAKAKLTPEEKATKRREWLEQNRERIKESNRLWRARNRNAQHEYNRQYYYADPDKARERTRQWRAQNQEKYLAYLAQRRANRTIPERREAELAQNRERYRASPEKFRAERRQYCEEHPEAVHEACRRWYIKNREYKLQWAKENHQKNRDRNCARVREYIAAHKEAYRQHDRNRRARRNSAEGRHTLADIRQLFEQQKGLCAACNVTLITKGKGKYHIDHIEPLSRGGSNWPANLQLLCPPCNIQKRDKDPQAWAAEQMKIV